MVPLILIIWPIYIVIEKNDKNEKLLSTQERLDEARERVRDGERSEIKKYRDENQAESKKTIKQKTNYHNSQSLFR